MGWSGVAHPHRLHEPQLSSPTRANGRNLRRYLKSPRPVKLTIDSPFGGFRCHAHDTRGGRSRCWWCAVRTGFGTASEPNAGKGCVAQRSSNLQAGRSTVSFAESQRRTDLRQFEPSPSMNVEVSLWRLQPLACRWRTDEITRPASGAMPLFCRHHFRTGGLLIRQRMPFKCFTC